jgi:hypothetical protein
MKIATAILLCGLGITGIRAQPVMITEIRATGPDWIELFNQGTNAVNLNGWCLTDDPERLAKWAFPAVILGAKEFLLVYATGLDERTPGQPLHTSFNLPKGGSYLALVGPDGKTIMTEFAPEYPELAGDVSYGFAMIGPVVQTNCLLFMEPTPGESNQGPSCEARHLVLTELMYHPAATPRDAGYEADEFEFIELKNAGPDTIDLANLYLYWDSGDYSFGTATQILGAGERVLLVANREAFVLRYGASLPIAGEFSGKLSNDGDRLSLRRLSGRTGESVFDFIYDDSWHRITDGHGFSLVLVNEEEPPANYWQPGTWRHSSRLGGSPGQADPPPPPIPRILVNEVLSAGELPFEDAIELFNPTDHDVDLSGWWLTDERDTPKKFQFPAVTHIPAQGFLALDEHAFNAPGDDPSVVGFGLGDFGEGVYLYSADAQGALTGWVHGFKFGASETNVTFGRHITSVGEERFVAQVAMTFFEANAGPKVGPVVLSEIHYHPPDFYLPDLTRLENDRDSYVELRNLSDQPVPLYDPAFPTNRWQLHDSERNGPLFVFPEGAAIPAGGRIIVGGVQPADPVGLAAFIASNKVPASTTIHGPLQKSLNKASVTLELLRPAAPQPGFVPLILVDRVGYADALPWPRGADGTGLALHRIDESAFGDDPVNWWAAFPTPGAASDIPPQLTEQPSPQTVVLGSDVTLRVSATGTSPITYQWLRDGQIIPGATDNVLRLTNVQPADGGDYSCRLLNIAAFVVTRIATLTVIDTEPPVLVVANPAVTPARVSLSPVTFTGIATDNVAVSTVLFQQDEGPYLPANGTTNWSVPLHLIPGFHTIRFVAIDSEGNTSATNTRTVLIETNPARLGLFIDGAGRVSGASHRQALVPGRNYSITARPATGHFFSHWSNWTAGIVSTNPALMFTMTSNLVLTAHFVPGPFVELAGSYQGLFFTATNPAHANAGDFTLRVTTRGTYTGRMISRARSHGLHGRFGPDLSARQRIQKPGTNDLFVNLQLAPGSEEVTGSVNDAFIASELRGHQTGFPDPQMAAVLAGRYTGAFFAMPEASASSPGTNTITVSASARFSLRGRLPDGTAVAKRLELSADGSTPLYLTLSRGAGSAFGWMHHTNSGAGVFQGPLLWTRTGARGFTNWVELRSRR